MRYNIKTTDVFENMVDFYETRKKYLKITQDITNIVLQLENGNLIGRVIPGLKLSGPDKVYKARLPNSSINVGKSNGFRLIYYLSPEDLTIYLLTIYSKKDREDISRKELINLISKIENI